MKTQTLKMLALFIFLLIGNWAFSQNSNIPVKTDKVQQSENSASNVSRRKAYLAKRKAWLARTNTSLNFGANTLTPNTDSKDLGMGTPIGINLGISKSLWSNENISFGLHGFGEYSFGNGKIDASKYPILKISGATSNTSAVSITPKMSGFGIGAGPQVNFALGENVMISPIVDFAYLSQKLDEYSVTQTSIYGGSNVNATLYKQNKIDASGLGIIPRLRLNYLISKNIGIWLEGNYVMGPKITTTTNTFKPSGNPAQDGTYNIDYIKTGTTTNTEISKNGGGIGFGGGIVIGLGGKNLATTTNTNVNQTSASCNCVPNLNYAKEYPSTGNTQNVTNGLPANLPISALTSGINIHFYFPNNPCYNTVNDPCYGKYQATINGHTITTPIQSSNFHMQIPVSYLVAGTNTITVKGICNGTICNLTSTVVNVNPPAQPTAITLTPDCCTTVSGPQHTSSYNGLIRFKISGVSNGCILEITNNGITSYLPIVNGNFTACYAGTTTFKLLDASTLLPVAGATINGSISYSYTKTWKSCINWKYVEIKKDLAISALKTVGLSGDYTDFSSETDGSSVYFVTQSNDTKTATVKTLKIPLEKEDGNNQLYLSGTPVLTTEVKGKLVSTKTLDPILSKKHNYVGHVTLLK